jgi:hypothetical protein
MDVWRELCHEHLGERSLTHDDQVRGDSRERSEAPGWQRQGRFYAKAKSRQVTQNRLLGEEEAR